MPTGYTAGILDGTIKDLKSFALVCARNFGATMHMRDHGFDVAYQPAFPSDYHSKAINKAKEFLAKYEAMSDDEIIAEEQKILTAKKAAYEEFKQKAADSNLKLKALLIHAQKFTPPSSEHEELKRFMIEQLESTIKFDGDGSYYDKELIKIEAQLSDLNAEDIRTRLVSKTHGEITYHTENYRKEVKRCEDANRWVADLQNSLNHV